MPHKFDNTEVVKLQKNLAKAVEAAAKNLEGWKRAKADYQNLQKESARRREETVKYATESFLEELLPLVDYFKYGFNGVPDEEKDSAWMQGMQHIYDQFMKTLEAHGVEAIKTVGETFDPNLHEAVDHVESKQKPDTILEETKSGFTLNGKVIQHAKVKVAKRPSLRGAIGDEAI